MDKILVTCSVAIPLGVALVGAMWYLVASMRRGRGKRATTGHVLRGQGDAITVAELLEEAVEQGEPVRLNWSAEDETRAREHRPWPNIRPYVQDEFPTAILSRIEDGEQGQAWLGS